VLVEVRQALELRALCERPVSHIDFDRHERDTPIFDNDDFEAIRKHLPLNPAFELRPLREQWRREHNQQQ